MHDDAPACVPRLRHARLDPVLVARRRRRWPTRFVRLIGVSGRSRVSRSSSCSARHCILCRSPRPCRRSRSVSRLRLFLARSRTRCRRQRARDRRTHRRGARRLGAGSLAMEVASNDGYLLQHYAMPACRCLASSRRANIAGWPRANGIPTRQRVLRHATSRSNWPATAAARDVFHANNVLAHVADLNGFVDGIRTVLEAGRRRGRSRRRTSGTCWTTSSSTRSITSTCATSR